MGYRKSLALVFVGLLLTVAAYVGAMRTAVRDAPVQAWVWARSFPRGHSASANDLRPVTVLARDLLPGMTVNPSQWKGVVTNAAVKEGDVVTERDIQPASPVPEGWETFYLMGTQSTIADPDLVPGSRVNLLVGEPNTKGEIQPIRLPEGGIFLGTRPQETGRPPLIRVAVPQSSAERLLGAESANRPIRLTLAQGG